MTERDNPLKKFRPSEGLPLDLGQESVDNVSVGNYWKRRYEEEKSLMEARLSRMEREGRQSSESRGMEEERVKSLHAHLQDLEQKMAWEKMVWEERYKTKTAELEFEKRKIALETQIKTLEMEAETVRSRLRAASASLEEERDKNRRLQADKERLEEDYRRFLLQPRAPSPEDQGRIRELEYEKAFLERQVMNLSASGTARPAKGGESEKRVRELEDRIEKLRRLLQSRDALEKSGLETVEDMARGFAHKVRNYLGVISGTLELCLSSFKMADDLKGQMVVVDENAKEMLKSIEDYLSLMKMPSLRPQPSEPGDVVSVAAAASADLAKSKGVAIRTDVAPDLPRVLADPTLLAPAFKEIRDNAIEASPAGGAVAVRLRLDEAANEVVAEISDSGKGISENHLKKIFQPYFTTAKGKKGLGLSMARRMVEMHRGAIQVETAVDRGTTVRVRLPAQDR